MEMMGPLVRSAALVLVFAACSSSSTGPAKGIAGTWSGTITQTNPVLTYPVTAVLTAGQGGTTAYGAPGPVCGGTLTQTGVSGNTYTYGEHITSGDIAGCADGGKVQATVNGNSLTWVWTMPVNPMPGDTDRTTLTRQ